MRRAGRLRVGQRFAVVAAVLGVLLMLGIVAGGIGLHRLTSARTALLDRIGPARTGTLQLQTAYLDQETGTRGFILTGEESFLEPYVRGRADERKQLAIIRKALNAAKIDGAIDNLDAAIVVARRWTDGFAAPAIAARRRGQPTTDRSANEGRRRFDALRASLDKLQTGLNGARDKARSRLDDAARQLGYLLATIALLLLLGGLAAAVFVRRAITLPLSRLNDEVRRVAHGDFDAEISATGPQDIVGLGDDVDGMRSRIVQELDMVRDIQRDLERSNAELEQFAYVASHDLQEPLRKVASFTQMLQRRYQGQLDDRADQYIFFAVDGAKRMQDLINDLLAFSRVGRVTREHRPVPLKDIVDRALTDLTGAIEASGAEVQVRFAEDRTPVVSVDAGLVALVFQNLVGNGIKFHDEDSVPHVQVTVTSVDGECEVAVHDDGIGIADEYADRIFVIFQRLHPKEEYGGTGIGLAMCRKIVEYHGGRIWLDTADGQTGTTFRFTLPLVAPPALAAPAAVTPATDHEVPTV